MNARLVINNDKKQLDYEGVQYNFDSGNVIYRGTTLIDGELEGIVIDTGNDCLIYGIEFGGIKEKTWLYKKVNDITFDNLYYLLMIATVISTILEKFNPDKRFIILMKSVILLLNTIVPLSLQSFYNMSTWILSKEIEQKNKVKINGHGMHSFQNVPKYIVTDKTGTITKNNLKLAQVININNNICMDISDSPTIENFHGIMSCSLINCHSGTSEILNTDEMEYLLLNWVLHADKNIKLIKNGKNIYRYMTENNYRDINKILYRSFSYDIGIKYSVTRLGETYILHIQGTPEAVNSYCGKMLELGEKMIVKSDVNYYNRTIAYAKKNISENDIKLLLTDKINIIELLNDFTFVNIYVFRDELVDDLEESFSKIIESGKHLTILTGDRMSTAIEVGKAVGFNNIVHIENKEDFVNLDGKYKDTIVINGKKLSEITCSIHDIYKYNRVIIYRASPSTKEHYINYLKENADGSKVLMIGDGANDISAITKADIGVGVIGENKQVQNVADIVIDNWRKIPDLLADFEEKKDISEHIVKWVLAKHLVNACILSSMMIITKFSQMRDPSNPYHMLLFNGSLFCCMIAYCKGYKFIGNNVNTKSYERWIGKSILIGLCIGSVFFFIRPQIGIIICLIIEFLYMCYKL